MPARYNYTTLKPKDGGQLSTRPSYDTSSFNNYVIKENWRRDLDVETRREGWLYFQPKAGELGAQHLNSGAPVTMLHMMRRPNGKTAILAASGDKLYRFFALEDPLYFVDEYMEDDCVYIDCEMADWIEIGSGFNTTESHRWEVVDLNGYAVLNNGVDLPVTYRVEDYAVKPLYQLREQGVASVGTIAEYNGMLICADITEIRDDYINTVLGGVDPYGPVSSDYTIRIQYRLLTSNISDPTSWGSPGYGTISAGSNTLVFSNLLPSWAVADTEITVAGAGADGGNLTTTILSVVGLSVILSDTASESVSGALVVKTADLGGTSGRYDLQDDGSQILRVASLENRLVVYRNRSIFLGSYTGSATSPLAFERVYQGDKTLYYRYTLVTVDGSYHLYAGANSFIRFDLTNRYPVDVDTLELSKDLFFEVASLTSGDYVFASNNPITKEVWFCYPNTPDFLEGDGSSFSVLAYDYKYGTASTIDAGFTAAAYVEKPLSYIADRATENWFIMGTVDGFVLQNGKTNEGFSYYSRLGLPYTSTLMSGLVSIGTDFNETDVRTYVLKYSSHSGNYPVVVSLFKTNSPHKAVTQIGARTFTDPSDDNMFPLWARAVYLQDKIQVSGIDNPVSVISRVYEHSLVGSRSAVTHNP